MFYLGIDGGGSGSRAVLADAEGVVLDRAEGGPANIATDYATTRANLTDLALRVSGGRPLGRLRAVLGLAGANLSGAAPRLEADLPFRAKVVQDVTTSLRGALGRADGIVAALGTGSVFARQLGGTTRAIGGWGFRMGDEASGAWIGRSVLNRLGRMLDGYHPVSPLAEALLAELGGGPGLVRFSLSAGPADFAALAPRLLAQRRDPCAQAVLAEAEAEIRKAIGLLQRTPPLPVVWLGGLGAALALPDWPSRPAAGNALDGALALARDAATWAG